jgi:hypothetical protein
MNRAKKAIRHLPRPPAMPSRFFWMLGEDYWFAGQRRGSSHQACFAPDHIREMLAAAKAPGGPDYADLGAAASFLNLLAADIREPPPPRAEAVAAWAKETAQAARDLLHRFGVDVKTLAAGGAALSPDARENLKGALEPVMILADRHGPLADLTSRMGKHAAHERPAAIVPAIDALAMLAIVADEAADFWHSHSKGAGANAKNATRKLAIRGAAAYRAGTGKEPGLNPEGPFARFLSHIATNLGVNIEAGAAVAAWRREAKRNR